MQRSVSWQLGAASGAVGAVLYAVSAFTAGSPLKPDATLPTVISHLSDKRDALLAGQVIALVAVGLLIWFLGYLRALLSEAEGDGGPLATVTAVSWIALFVIIIGGDVPLAVIIWHGPSGIAPSTVGLAFDGSNLSLYSLSAVAALLSVLAPIVVIWRTGVLPRWLVVLGAIEIVVNVVEIAGLFSRSGFNDGGYVDGIGPFVWVVWVAAVSICMVIKVSSTSKEITSMT